MRKYLFVIIALVLLVAVIFGTPWIVPPYANFLLDMGIDVPAASGIITLSGFFVGWAILALSASAQYLWGE